MSGGQIVGLVFAILLLLPGGCFLFFGVGLSLDKQMLALGNVLLIIAAILLGGSGLLFWDVFRRRKPKNPPS